MLIQNLLVNRNILIAESGGSKTDWVLYRSDGTISEFSTRSYRVDSFEKGDLVSQKDFFDKKKELLNSKLFFFGAGCHSIDGSAKQKELLEIIGFKQIRVFSDLQAAGYSAYGPNETGWVAIHGTGSVLFYWDGKSVVKLIGGKGFIDGDEGSGAHLGRVGFDLFESNRLSLKQYDLIKKLIDSEKYDYSLGFDKSICVKLGDHISRSKDDWSLLHQKNMNDFTRKYLSNIEGEEVIVIGGYAFNNKNIVKESYASKSVLISRFIEKPIRFLIERIDVLSE